MFSKLQILNSYHLKILALLIMVFDHFGAMFYPDLDWIRIIGRISFILYAFMIVEGVSYTKNIHNYIFKVFTWAFISEIPFDLAFHGQPFFFAHQNIFFSLLISILGLYYFTISKNFLFSIIVGMLCLIVSYFLSVDYSWYGVLTVFIFYFFKRNSVLKYALIETFSMIASFSISGLQFFAFLGFIPIIFYNGKQGKKIGNFYYSFYAIHLLIFSIIKLCFSKP
jgi:hypothetical protein